MLKIFNFPPLAQINLFHHNLIKNPFILAWRFRHIKPHGDEGVPRVGIQHDRWLGQHMDERVELGVRQETSEDCGRNDFPRWSGNGWTRVRHALRQVRSQENALHLRHFPINFR